MACRCCPPVLPKDCPPSAALLPLDLQTTNLLALVLATGLSADYALRPFYEDVRRAAVCGLWSVMLRHDMQKHVKVGPAAGVPSSALCNVSSIPARRRTKASLLGQLGHPMSVS